jgi:hypothetical protein
MGKIKPELGKLGAALATGLIAMACPDLLPCLNGISHSSPGSRTCWLGSPEPWNSWGVLFDEKQKKEHFSASPLLMDLPLSQVRSNFKK